MAHLLTTDLAGPFNLTSPEPVTAQRLLHDGAGRVGYRPTLLPTPSFGPKLLLGSELTHVLLYESKRAVPRALLDSGFTFRYPALADALRATV